MPDDQVVTYNVGCPAVFANEADLAQAVLTFQREGVTHVIAANFQGDIARFTAHAEQQGFRPRYGFPDEALLSIASGSRAPEPRQHRQRRRHHAEPRGREPHAGHDADRRARSGATRTGTAAGLPPVYDVPANAGHACDQLWMLQAALGRAPELSAAGPAGGPAARPGRSTSRSRRARTTSPASGSRPAASSGGRRSSCPTASAGSSSSATSAAARNGGRTRGSRMAWDFETDPEFQEKLDWAAEFVREEVEPLDYLFPHQQFVPLDEAKRRIIDPLKEEVRSQGLWATHLGPRARRPGVRPAASWRC